MTAALITGPALEPVSLAEAKAHLRLDTDDDDQLVTAAIAAARVHVEAATRRALIEQEWRVYLDAWPKRRIVTIPVAPLIAVDAVTVFDHTGDPVPVDAGDYEVDTVSVPGRLVLSSPLPVIVGRAVNGIEIDVTAGYGPSSVDVPAALRQAVMMLVAHWYEHRGAVGHDLALAAAPLGFEALVAPYRVLSL
ncbi:MAG TPA: head-tail connector protein [Bauldia sp.]|nr:head-tail connector protein [Bauldia sp.]